MFSVPTRVLVVLGVLAIVVSAGCGPTDEALAAMIEAEVERQVALIPPAPQGDPGQDGPQGPQGLQGVEGSQGLVGPEGQQGETGPQGPQGVAGPQGLSGPAGPEGPRGVAGSAGPVGPMGPAGVVSGIPNVLEVEELIIKSQAGGGYMRLAAGGEGRVAKITWHHTNGNRNGTIWAGSQIGLMLEDRNDDDSFTAYCVHEGTFGLCPM